MKRVDMPTGKLIFLPTSIVNVHNYRLLRRKLIHTAGDDDQQVHSKL